LTHATRPRLSGAVNRAKGFPVAHKFEIYKDKAGEFRVRFKYNSEIIFSTEGYASKSGAKSAVESIKKHVGDAEVVEIE
jgi:uncharacterized protein YegP (UPF0339 family)